VLPRLRFECTRPVSFLEDNLRLRPYFNLVLGLRYVTGNRTLGGPTHFAPRLAFAYSPANRKTIFKTEGVFYDQLPEVAVGTAVYEI